MTGFVIRRVVSAIPVLFLVTLIAYAIRLITPGDAATALAGATATAEEIERLRAQLGLDQSPLRQLLGWYAGLFRGDLGTSLLLERPVTEAFLERAPITIALAVCSILLSMLVGVTLGIAAAIRRNSWIDWAVVTFAVGGIAVPNFWLGLALILVFSVKLGWTPAGGLLVDSGGQIEWVPTMILPVIALAMTQVGLLARMTRSSMLEVLGQDYVRTARAKGLPEYIVIFKHSLRNALIPIVTVAGIIFSRSLGGAVVIEQVFALPGIGRLTMMSIFNRDYAVVQAALLISGVLFVAINLLVDVLAKYINPRIRHAG